MRVSKTFVNVLSGIYAIGALCMLGYLWVTQFNFSELFTNMVSFAANLGYVVVGALLWPGTLLAQFYSCIG